MDKSMTKANLFVNGIEVDFEHIDLSVDIKVKQNTPEYYKELEKNVTLNVESRLFDLQFKLDKSLYRIIYLKNGMIDIHVDLTGDREIYDKFLIFSQLLHENLLDRKLLTEIKLSDVDLFERIVDVFNLDLEEMKND